MQMEQYYEGFKSFITCKNKDYDSLLSFFLLVKYHYLSRNTFKVFPMRETPVVYVFFSPCQKSYEEEGEEPLSSIMNQV